MVVVSVQFDHWELLLKRTRPRLFGFATIVVRIPSVLLCHYLDHLAVVRTVLFRVGLVPTWWITQGHCSLTTDLLPFVNIGITVTINGSISINKDMMISLRVLYTLRQGLLLVVVSEDELLCGASRSGRSLPSIHRCDRIARPIDATDLILRMA